MRIHVLHCRKDKKYTINTQYTLNYFQQGKGRADIYEPWIIQKSGNIHYPFSCKTVLKLMYEGCFFFNLRWAIKKRQIDIT